jgi:hypothetical protein
VLDSTHPKQRFGKSELTKEGVHMESDTNNLPEGLARSKDAYLRQLPALVSEHYGEWVAFREEEIVGFSPSAAILYQRCEREGLQRHQFFVGKVARPVNSSEFSR